MDDKIASEHMNETYLKVRVFETQRCELPKPVSCDALKFLITCAENIKKESDVHEMLAMFKRLRGVCETYGRENKLSKLNGAETLLLPCQERCASIRRRLDTFKNE